MTDVRSAQGGFTLIEVLVALTLMALVSLISWRGLDAVQQSGERLDDRAEETLAVVRALGQIERDLLLHAGADVLPGLVSAVPGGAADDTPRMPVGIAWDAQTGLSLVRSAGDGLWQQLRWYLHDGKLIRAAGAPSYLLPLPDVQSEVVVLEQVSGLSVRMWQPGQGWVEPPRVQRNSAATGVQDNEQGTAPNNAQGSPRAGAAGQGSAMGLEIALHRQGLPADQAYRKVVVLP